MFNGNKIFNNKNLIHAIQNNLKLIIIKFENKSVYVMFKIILWSKYHSSFTDEETEVQQG